MVPPQTYQRFYNPYTMFPRAYLKGMLIAFADDKIYQKDGYLQLRALDARHSTPDPEPNE